ncbi:MAG: hypothetical protein QM736_28560 [Vicinamibacterales bacterium]
MPSEDAADDTQVVTWPCETCGYMSEFKRIDRGPSDDRWECTRCGAHRFEPHGKAGAGKANAEQRPNAESTDSTRAGEDGHVPDRRRPH